MKKFLILFLICGVSTVTFAQFSWELGADFNTGLFSWSIPTGERTEQFITVGGNKVINDTVNNPVGNRGDYSYSSGTMDVFTYGRGTWLRHNELRLSISYESEFVKFYSRTLLDALVMADINGGSGTNSLTDGHSFTADSGRTPNWGDYLLYSFDEYYFRGNAGFLSGYVGNTPDRGKVDNFHTLTEDVLRTVMVEGYGVNTPTADADFAENGQDINNLMTSPKHGSEDVYNYVLPYFMVGVAAIAVPGNVPLTLQIAADPGNNSGINGGNNYLKFNGAVRFSAEKIADRITFDAIYRFKGGDPDTLYSYDKDYRGGIVQPDGKGRAAHAFGLYANVLNVPGLDIGLGYSAYLVAYELDLNTAPNPTGRITRVGPLFSGIDLRLRYTSGIDGLTISSFNNVSFANSGTPTIPSEHYSMGIFGTELAPDTTQSWFALYNALGFDFLPGGRFRRLAFSFQIANRYGKIATDTASTVVRSRNQLAGGGYIVYTINQHLLLQGGLAFRYLHDSYSNDAPGAQDAEATRDASGGAFEIAIPIRLKLVFGRK